MTPNGPRHPYNEDLYHKNPFIDPRGRRMYHVTLVVQKRQKLFGHLEGDINAVKGTPDYPHIVYLPLGQELESIIYGTHDYYIDMGTDVTVERLQVMPDHVHVLLFMRKESEIPIGQVVRHIKTKTTSFYKQQLIAQGVDIEAMERQLAKELQEKMKEDRGYELSKTSSRTRPSLLWDKDPRNPKGYHEVPLTEEGQLETWHNYLIENPWRRMVMDQKREFFMRVMHIVIGTHEYAAYGNIMLLRRPMKRAVMVHREAQRGQRDADGRLYPFGTPYIDTVQYAQEYRDHMAAAREYTVLVGGWKSKGETRIFADACALGYDMIKIDPKPITRDFKPQGREWRLCADGHLLYLSPWRLEEMGDYAGVPTDTDYSHFHNINTLAEEVAALDYRTGMTLVGGRRG